MPLPSWLVAEVWIAFGPEAKSNALDAMRMMTWDFAEGDDDPVYTDPSAARAAARGVPDRPIWLKKGPKPPTFFQDMRQLRAEVDEEIRAKIARNRMHAAEVKDRQRLCEHVWDEPPPGAQFQRCGKCGLVS